MMALDMNAQERGIFQNLPSSSSSNSSSNADSDRGSVRVESDSDSSLLFDSQSEAEEEIEEEEMGQMFAAYEELLFGAPQARIENYLEVVHEMSDEQFRRDYRLHRAVAYDLIDSLDASGFIPNHPEGKEKKSAELSFLLFLSLVSSDQVFRETANLFGCGSTTVFRVIRRITEWLLTIMPEHIVWPRGAHIQQTAHDFAQRAGVENCIGAIDGSHIFIEKPIDYGRVYWCRKERYSIVLQAVVNFDMLFTNVSCGDPGSYHDTRVLRRSELYNIAEHQLEDLFPNGKFLLGDKGYIGVGRNWIVTPFKDYGNLTAEQTDFNVRVSSTRVVVEQAFGILKSRFRYLRGIMRLRDVHFAARLVVACCVLHNVCIRSGDNAEDFIADEDSDDENGCERDRDSGSEEGNGSEGRDSGQEDDDRDDDVPIPNNRTLTVFRLMYPGAVVPPNRNRRANNA
ncbi:Protein ALP1-like [Frankliniella fusca]|uniref:Protein ALP1-like n=1 Tax=Frankliniella fusca TaxID=407009 RepID=A0AAE1L788_9NEOP|nr:Protein ALP1-like [Frankliniella fusca]KAK3909817.1 Protein ALP1-like [Frankliniella fusca]